MKWIFDVIFHICCEYNAQRVAYRFTCTIIELRSAVDKMNIVPMLLLLSPKRWTRWKHSIAKYNGEMNVKHGIIFLSWRLTMIAMFGYHIGCIFKLKVSLLRAKRSITRHDWRFVTRYLCEHFRAKCFRWNEALFFAFRNHLDQIKRILREQWRVKRCENKGFL